MGDLAGPVNAADREWTIDVAASMLRWLGSFCGAALVVEIVEHRSLRDALAGLPSRCEVVLPLAAALGAGLAYRAWTADGRLVAVCGSGWSPARLGAGAALVAASISVAVLAISEVAPRADPAGGEWVALSEPLLPGMDGSVRLWIRARELDGAHAAGIDALWLRDGALVAAGRAVSAEWDGSRWTVRGAPPTWADGVARRAEDWALPDPRVWRDAARPGPGAPISTLLAADPGPARSAWLTGRLLGFALAASAATLGVAGSRHLPIVSLGAAFAAILQTTLGLAVTQGRSGAGVLLVVPALAIAGAATSLLALDRRAS